MSLITFFFFPTAKTEALTTVKEIFSRKGLSFNFLLFQLPGQISHNNEVLIRN